MSRSFVAAPIEHFIWTKQDKVRDKLVYFDQNGAQFEKNIAHNVLEETLQAFNGKLKAIRRSSGGLTHAEPYQLVLFEGEGPDKPAKLGVRVRFTDLKRDEKNNVIGKEAFLHSKIVSAGELKDGIVLDLETPQPLLAEFGRGLVPIHVFQYSVDANGFAQAHFVLENDLAKIAESRRDETIPLQTYLMIRDALRFSDPTLRSSELVIARDNADWQSKSGESVIPNCLQLGEPIPVPGATSPQLCENILRISLDPKDREFLEPIFINIRKEDESALIPFGLFERP